MLAERFVLRVKLHREIHGKTIFSILEDGGLSVGAWFHTGGRGAAASIPTSICAGGTAPTALQTHVVLDSPCRRGQRRLTRPPRKLSHAFIRGSFAGDRHVLLEGLLKQGTPTPEALLMFTSARTDPSI
ncbi:hypothetical protein F2P79_013743 [Pimephales promelas]|nr:hypothetical protein F2P79_013743 [Pimephales promelas]KAG1946255.1 hypothetical protein F2P79_013743 [Pimephales promelas]KAG1946256.1 hypothetical protein F2P79_013743 [Pimephales promelas]KAG1946257.1 hypothetical protein F2P79_013743 [Pimephales promelas]KAG1946258.1 hypothetical protein F2P79_013743 [Pimephales promelas]